MDRAASEIETELVDLSTATLRDLDDAAEFAPAIRRLLDLVESPPTLVNAADGGGCFVAEDENPYPE